MSDAEAQRMTELERKNAALQAELERLRAGDDGSRRARWRRIRRITAAVLVVLTSISVVAATVSVWTRATAFDTDRYVSLVAPLAQEPAVQEPLADYLTDQAYQALDVQGRVEEALASSEALADRADLLAPAIAEGARTLMHDQVLRFIRSDAFQNLWTRLLTAAHEKVVALLRGDYEELPNVVIEAGEVKLDLIPALAQVLRQLVERGVALVGADVTIPTISDGELPETARARLSVALGRPLPEDLGQVTILSEQQLSDMQDAVRTFDRLVWFLLVLTAILVVATLVVSVSRRRTLLQLCIGVVAALFLGVVAIRRIRDELVAGITAPEGRGAAREVFAATLSDLRSVGLLVLWIAVAVAVVAYFAGQPRWVTGATRRLRTAFGEEGPGPWAARHADALRVVTLAAGALVLFVTGIDWAPVILVGLLVALAFWGLALITRPSGEAR